MTKWTVDAFDRDQIVEQRDYYQDAWREAQKDTDEMSKVADALADVVIEQANKIAELQVAIKDARDELAHKKGGTAMEVYQILTRAIDDG